MEPILVVFLGVLATAAFGWIGWVSLKLVEISVAVTGLHGRVKDHDRRIGNLEDRI